ncbi:MAG TPA: hypothetical protein VML95_06645 [Longimicrobiales bacterium]|nr:hypothetical protein [Longimicrobiales bacterium]
MKIRFAFAAALLSIAVAGAPVSAYAAQATKSVDGKWTMDVQTDQGSMVVGVDFKSDGKKITGTISSPQGDAPLVGEFEDGKIAFGISIDSPEGAMAIGFAGAMNDDGTLAGTLTGPFGDAPWTAARVK